jgi:hypothetical protein
MSRRITKGYSTLNIVEHIIVKSGWEYYVTDDESGEDTRLCYVMGFENEFGYVWLPEIEPYIVSRTKNLKNLLPPEGGWNWVD